MSSFRNSHIFFPLVGNVIYVTATDVIHILIISLLAATPGHSPTNMTYHIFYNLNFATPPLLTLGFRYVSYVNPLLTCNYSCTGV